MIPYGKQSISDEDVAAVVEVLRSDWLTQGPTIPAFEEAVAKKCAAAGAVAVSNGTAALHLACLALGLGPDDWLWTSPITFVASANCARYCGASVDFVDVEPGTRNICIKTLADKLAIAERDGLLPKILVAVHFSGNPCDMPAIAALADRYGFSVIEDAAHAIGAGIGDSRTGDGQYSALTTFSFHPVKLITSGEGGMVMANDPALLERLQILRSHGVTRDLKSAEPIEAGPWYYEQLELGWNYRITDLQAALGLSQLKRLPEFVSRRTELAQRYDDKLSDLPLELPRVPPGHHSAWHLYPISLNVADKAERRAEVFTQMRDSGIGVNVHYIPVYRQPYYLELGVKREQYPNAEAYYQGAISLPLFPGLSEAEQDVVCQTLTTALSS